MSDKPKPDRFPKSRRMIFDAIEEAIFDAFDMEPPADNSRPIRDAGQPSADAQAFEQ
jgi:hypothetical protein